jgi:hypothetical protein
MSNISIKFIKNHNYYEFHGVNLKSFTFVGTRIELIVIILIFFSLAESFTSFFSKYFNLNVELVLLMCLIFEGL